MKLLFVYNRKAGRKFQRNIQEQILACLPKELDSAFVDITQFDTYPLDGFTSLIAVGGDGTVNCVAQRAILNNLILGIIPKGSGDGLARHLGIPKDVSRAMNIVMQGNTSQIDTALLNSYLFVNIAGCGFEAKVAHRFNQVQIRGLFGYIRTVFSVFGSSSEKFATLITDKKEQKIRFFSLSIANGAQWGNNVTIASEADVQDGLLDVAVMKKPRILQIPLLLSYFSSNRMKSNKLITYFKAQEIRVLKAGKKWHIDGEPIKLKKKVKIKIRPKSLTIYTA